MYKNQYPEITLDEIQTFIRLYNEDHQVKEIAKIVHRHRHVVSRHLKSSFLRALFTGDGHVTLSLRKVGGRFYLVYCVCLSCRNRKLQSQYKKMLNDLHIKCNQSPEGLVIKRKNCIKLFKNKIGFLNGAKIFKSPYWKICEKNAILNTICNFNRISFCSPDEGWSYILKKVKQKTD